MSSSLAFCDISDSQPVSIKFQARFHYNLFDILGFAMTEVVKEFVTPDRSLCQATSLDDKKNGLNDESSVADMTNKQVATVTPPESGIRDENAIKREDDRNSPLEMVTNNQVDSPEDRKVRFDHVEMADSVSDSPSSNCSQRGLVSRRGGRCASPGRIACASPKKEQISEYQTYRSPTVQKDASDSVPSLSSDTSPDKATEVKASKDDGAGNSSSNETKEAGPLSSQLDSAKKGKSNEKKSNVSFSPVPPPRDATRTPTRSPTGRFQSLPVLDDDTLRSPGSFFLSPHPPTPSSRILRASGSFDKLDLDRGKGNDDDDKPAVRQPMRSPKTPRSPRTPRRDDRDRFLTTPTDFAMDYGKHPHSGSFDSSNVLAWLQSPTANGLFSPGGFGSMLNTPRGIPRTPRTPTVSTSFFFSDVAGLPGSGDTSPKSGAESKKGHSRGMSNIICISPLASSKVKGGAHASLTPTINYKDMFASPEKSRALPLLGDSPLKISKTEGVHRSGSRDPSIDAVHIAERELMEDEDLSVLLQLASNTPKANGERPVAVSTSDGTRVFRSPQSRTDGQTGDENLPSLQLPIIGGREGESNATRLSRKTHSRDHGDGTETYHRPLGMRSSSQSSSQANKSDMKHDGVKADSITSDGGKKRSKPSSLHPPPPGYMGHHYPHHDPHSYYPHMPPGMPPHTGSMRVVVGGPPPSRAMSSPPRSPPSRGYSVGPQDPNYPPPPYGHYGVPPPHMHPHYYPPPQHHPPPRHMPMYGAQHPPGKSKTSDKKITSINPPSKAVKRPSTPLTPPKAGSAKKQKKSPPSGATSSVKKKSKTPPVTDKVERQKAAANIKAVNEASGSKNDKAAALAAAILRGVTMRPSGKWQAQLYFAGKSRYIGVFDSREKAALAYEIAREKLKTEKQSAEGGSLSPKATEAAVNAARKAAFEGVNERDPRV